jgi:hypothetical protein
MRPQIAEDDISQHTDIVSRLARLEQFSNSLIGPYQVISGDIAPGAYALGITPIDPGLTTALPDFTTLTNFVVTVDKVDVTWGLEVQWQRDGSGYTFSFWNAGAHNPAACVLYVMAVLV